LVLIGNYRVKLIYTMNENARTLTQFRPDLEVKGDGKCYFRCNDCRGLQTRRILITTTENHFRERGRVEGGYEYHFRERGNVEGD
jgi:hypothetical protein